MMLSCGAAAKLLTETMPRPQNASTQRGVCTAPQASRPQMYMCCTAAYGPAAFAVSFAPAWLQASDCNAFLPQEVHAGAALSAVKDFDVWYACGGKEALTMSKGLQAGCEHLHATRQVRHTVPPSQPSLMPCDELRAYRSDILQRCFQ